MHEPLPFYKSIKAYLDNMEFETNEKVLVSTFNNNNNSSSNNNGSAIPLLSNSNPFNGNAHLCNNTNTNEMMRNERSKSCT